MKPRRTKGLQGPDETDREQLIAKDEFVTAQAKNYCKEIDNSDETQERLLM